MSNTEVAVIWRNDGVINYVIPASTLVNTFFATVLRHDKWLCQFVNELALVTTPESVKDTITEKQERILVTLKDGLAKSSGSHTPIEESASRLKAGTEDHLPGMFYGTMHPTELSVLAYKVDEVVEISGELGMTATESGREQMDTIAVWTEAAKKFVRPSEAMSTLLGEVGDA